MAKECRDCNGTGWILRKDSRGLETAVKCHCRREDQLMIQGRNANIPQRFLGAELEWFLPEDRNPSQEMAKRKAQRFIKDYPAVDKGLLLQGPVGVGKTKLLCSIAFELIREKRVDVYYMDWTQLVRQMRSGEDNTNRDFLAIDRLIRRMESVGLLILDEIGATRVSPYVYDNIYYLINSRYNAGKTVLGATNFSDESQMNQETLSQRVGERLRSRLYEMTEILGIRGSDFRKKNC